MASLGAGCSRARKVGGLVSDGWLVLDCARRHAGTGRMARRREHTITGLPVASGAIGRILWAYALRRAGSKWPTPTAVAGVRRRLVAWFLAVGSSRIAAGVTRGPAAWRAVADAASSGTSGRDLWAYGLRRAGLEWPTRAEGARAQGRPTVWFRTVGSSRIADGVTRGPAVERAGVGAISSAAVRPCSGCPCSGCPCSGCPCSGRPCSGRTRCGGQNRKA
jgi:hypothetical protein